MFFYGSDFFKPLEKNNKVKKLIKNLTFSKSKLAYQISNKKSYEDFLIKANENSKKLFEEFDLNNNLESADKIIDRIVNMKFLK